MNRIILTDLTPLIYLTVIYIVTAIPISILLWYLAKITKREFKRILPESHSFYIELIVSVTNLFCNILYLAVFFALSELMY